MTSTALIEEQLSNLSTFEEPSTATTTEDVEISTSLSIPAKRPLLDRNFLDRTCKKKREAQALDQQLFLENQDACQIYQ
ncbi:8327_t:CDS:2 [Funneliformis geosporum]|uniref:8327_t:CDS:1 n=1 Tax=Funneliformis geosporum TaxID=1117311 RepID=A0A9W4SL81_9GLOM|nr:8327_t:CDS:2 [Funneliformis geosporum]